MWFDEIGAFAEAFGLVKRIIGDFYHSQIIRMAIIFDDSDGGCDFD
jgi:hypothetical protein